MTSQGFTLHTYFMFIRTYICHIPMHIHIYVTFLCTYIYMSHSYAHTYICHIPMHIHIYIYILIVLYITIDHAKNMHNIYVLIQNYSARRFLSFGCKGKATTATGNVNTFKIVSQKCTDILVCNQESKYRL